MAIFKKKQPQPEVTSSELAERIKGLEEKIKDLRRAVTKIGIVRFNPFKEIGGNQSFSLALLDEEQNGVVVTSYYGRELNRVYAKPIKSGTSEHELSVEEKEAIGKAIGSENPKHEARNSKRV